jgi:hypothetical protein
MTYISNLVRREGNPKVLRPGPSSLTASDRLGKALGWFSLGLGLVESLAPHRITRTLGMEGKEGLVRAYGAREIAGGILSLSTERSVGLWSRVGGDSLDIATLLTALRRDNPQRHNVKTALAMVVGITLLDVIAARGTTGRQRRNSGRKVYRHRTGFPSGLEMARGAAKEFQAPRNMRASPAAGGPEQTHDPARPQLMRRCGSLFVPAPLLCSRGKGIRFGRTYLFLQIGQPTRIVTSDRLTTEPALKVCAEALATGAGSVLLPS